MYILLFCGKSNSILISNACTVHLKPGDHNNDLISFFTAEEFSYWHLSKVLRLVSDPDYAETIDGPHIPLQVSINAPYSLVTISLSYGS